MRKSAIWISAPYFVPDEAVMKIVAGWPRNFAPDRAIELGFQAEANFDEIVRIYIEEENPPGV